MTKRPRGDVDTQPFADAAQAAWHRRHWERNAADPFIWQASARERICAANVLRDRFNQICAGVKADVSDLERNRQFASLVSSAMMLYGLAVENLLKGLIIAKGAPAIRNGSLSREVIGNGDGHDLCDLAKRAGLQIAAEDRDLLLTLTIYVRRSGKYWVSLRAPSGLGPPSRDVETNLTQTLHLLGSIERAFIIASSRSLPEIDLTVLCSEQASSTEAAR